MITDHIIGRFANVETTANGWAARCPCHDDKTNSLSITPAEDGKTLVHCHAGCKFADIVAAVGLKPADFMPPKQSSGKPFGEIVQTYNYVDENGDLLFQVCRMNPKDFRQRKPNSSGGWDWKTKGVRQVLYRLPELIAQPLVSVYVVEGEKDVDRLRSLGLVATCNAGGAGKWKTKPEFLEPLRGREIIILPDNDGPGRKHADEVAHSLVGIADEIRILALPDLPPKGDVSDWLNAGGDVEQLVALVEQTPLWEPSAEPESDEETSDETSNDDKWTSIKCDEGRTDVAFARRFLRDYGDNVRYVAAWDAWLVWDGTRWKLDTGMCAVLRMANAVADSIWKEVSKYHTEDAVDFAQDMHKPSKWKSALKAAGIYRTVAVDELDSNPYLWNAPNGTVDLRTGKIRPHDRGDMLTKCCPTEFDTAAQCPTWERFILEVFGGSEPLANYMQSLAGWGLTGLIREHLLHIAFGVGANGKSTLFNTLSDVFGEDYSMTAVPGMLIESRNESHPTERADLFGKRLVIASETESGAKLSESLVKQLTGGDKVRARRMREDFWQFDPTHKLVMLTNHKPRVRGTDHAIWRRLRLLPFTEVFEGARKDEKLPEKLAAEAAGILAWAVRGAGQWLADGLNPPSEVQAATSQYRTSQDVFGRFVGECCVVGSSGFVTKFADLRNALKRWCEDTGENEPSPKSFGVWLQDQGMEAFMSAGRKYRGIGLKSEM